MAGQNKPQQQQAFDNSRWWMNQQNVGQIEAIKQQQIMERERLDFQKEKFSEILSLYEGAFNDSKGDSGFTVPDAFAQNVALFQPGGQFGEGARMEIERGGQQAIAAGQIGFARTGMSSGTKVAALQARVLADTALSKAKVEDARVTQLGGALTQAGAAGLTTQQLRAQRESEMLRSLSSFA